MGTFRPSLITSRQLAVLKMPGTLVGYANARCGNVKIFPENLFHQQMRFVVTVYIPYPTVS